MDRDVADTNAMRVYAARIYSRGRCWEESTRRWLAQIGLDHRTSQSLIDGNVPDGMALDAYRDARIILAVRRDLRNRIASAMHTHPDTPAAPFDEGVLLRHAAEDVAAGEGVFAVLADLAFDLTSRGLRERMPPLVFDRKFWVTQDDASQFFEYLTHMDTVEIPTLP